MISSTRALYLAASPGTGPGPGPGPGLGLGLANRNTETETTIRPVPIDRPELRVSSHDGDQRAAAISRRQRRQQRSATADAGPSAAQQGQGQALAWTRDANGGDEAADGGAGRAGGDAYPGALTRCRGLDPPRRLQSAHFIGSRHHPMRFWHHKLLLEFASRCP